MLCVETYWFVLILVVSLPASPLDEMMENIGALVLSNRGIGNIRLLS